MGHTRATLRTDLRDRILWFDGTSTFTPDCVGTRSGVKYVTELTPDIEQYNQFVSTSDEIVVKNTCNDFTAAWVLPSKYLELDVIQYIACMHSAMFENNTAELPNRQKRLAQELHMFKDRNLIEVLRAIIYVINTLSSHDIVWGIGRGSSVSSYVLYVIGAHDVDSFAYGLPIEDFLHD